MRPGILSSVRVRVATPYPERFLNAAAGSGIAFSGLETPERGIMELNVSSEGYEGLLALSEKTGFFTAEMLRERGLLRRMRLILRRPGLILGLLLALGAVYFSSFFIWQIEVLGNESVSDHEIISALRELGIKEGTSVFAVDNRLLQDKLLLKLPSLGWIAVNVRGSRAYVLCREKMPIPAIIDHSAPSELVAAKPGVIEKITVVRGEAAVKEGDAVDGGELLIAGTDINPHSEGVVTARTYYEFSAKMPLACSEKSYTGRETTRTAIIFGEKRINFYFSGGNPYPYCDKITEYEPISLPGGSALPVTVVRETFRETAEREILLPRERAEAILRARLIERLNLEISGGSIKEREFTSEVENGVVTVTVRAECLEEIQEER